MTSEHGLDRREFLKSLAALGAGLGATAAVGMTAAGEVLQSPTAGGLQACPWWVRRVAKPTTGIDWARMERYDAFRRSTLGPAWPSYIGEAEHVRMQQRAAEAERQRILEGDPGYSLPDQALYKGLRSALDLAPPSFLGPRISPSPADRGVPRWEGSPEEASALIKAALRYLGAASVGIVHLDENTRKLIYAADADGKQIFFEDVPQAYETEAKRVIPYRCEWAVVYTVQMSLDTMKRAPTRLASAATFLGYLRARWVQVAAQEFLHGLGYQALGEAHLNALAVAPGLAVLAGLGELSRQNRLITPEYGPMVRISKLITDLPLAEDSPIDAGIVRFCRVCKKCAEACPAAAISFADEPFWEPMGPWNNPGHQAWFEDGVRCRRYWVEEAGSDCGICFAVCPFAKRDASFLHRMVKMQVATLPAADGVVRSFDDALGYGEQKEPAQWWRLDLPEYGIDTTQGKEG